MAATVVQTPTSVTYNGATVAAVSVSFAATPTAGNAIAVVAAIVGPSTLTSATDNQSGNSYTLSQAGGGSGTRLGLGYDTAANSSGTFTVSINFSSVQIWGRVGAVEIADIKDQAADASGTVSGVNVGTTDVSVSTSGSTTKANCFILSALGLLGFNSKTITACATGYSLAYSDSETGSFPGMGLAHKSVTSTGTQTATWAHDNNGGLDGAGIIVAFEEASYQYTYPASILYNSDGWQEIGGGSVTVGTLADGSDGTPNDADGAESPLSASTDALVFAMTDLTDPNDDTGHRGTLRYKKSASGGDTMGLVAEWRKGYTNEGAQGTLVKTLLSNQNVGSTITQLDLNLSTGEAATVDYADMVLRLVANTEADGSAAPSLRAAGAGAVSAADATPIAPGLPSGWQPNDIHLLIVATNQQTAWTDLSATWTELTGHNLSSANFSSKMYWRRAVGGDSAPSISRVSGTSLSSSNGLYGRIYGFQNCITSGTPFEDETSAGGSSTDQTPDTSEITTTGADRYAVSIVAIDDNGSITNNPPSTWSALGTNYQSGTGGDCSILGIGKTIASASTVTSVVICDIAAVEYHRQTTLALLPNPATRRVQVTWARFRVPEVGGITGTGTLASGSAAVSGSGLSSSSGTGVLAAQASTVVGSGVSSSSGTGVLAAGASTLAGSGLVQWLATGALQAGSSTIVGAGLSSSSGTGVLQSQSSVVVGEGTVEITGVDGSGVLQVADSTVEGSGIVQWIATGSLVVADAIMTGAGISSSTGTGVLQADAFVIVGIGEAAGVITGSGILLAGDAAIVGTGLSSSAGTGVLQAQSSIIVGLGVVGVPGATVVIFDGPNKGVGISYHHGVSRPIVHITALGGGNFDVVKSGGVSGDLAAGQVSAEGYLIDGELP